MLLRLWVPYSVDARCANILWLRQHERVSRVPVPRKVWCACACATFITDDLAAVNYAVMLGRRGTPQQCRQNLFQNLYTLSF